MNRTGDEHDQLIWPGDEETADLNARPPLGALSR
jgi:hypothetical protein